MKGLENKVIVITGTPGGIGSKAQKLADERAKVFLADMDEQDFRKESLVKQEPQIFSELCEEINEANHK